MPTPRPESWGCQSTEMLRAELRRELTVIGVHCLPRQLTIALHAVQMNGLSVPKRNAVLLRLAPLLMEAAGVEEGADDGR